MALRQTTVAVLGLMVFVITPNLAWADGISASGGQTLLQTPSARSASMGEALSAESDDISAFHYNPATLASLKSTQATFLYQSGIAEDRFSTLSFGLLKDSHNWGFSLGYYDGGDVEVYDGVQSRMVNAKTDLTAMVGYGRPVGRFFYGVSGKYLSSKLADTASASALAMDGGIGLKWSEKLTFGASLQNIGSALKYDRKEESLPVILRTGLSSQLLAGKMPLKANLDLPYHVNDRQIYLGLGTELRISLVALRLGYSTVNDLGGFSMGMGFRWKNSSFDYSFGLVDELNSRHLISFSQRFGQTSTDEFVKKEYQPSVYLIRTPNETGKGSQNTYVVRPGDTLEEISYRVYGERRLWTTIFFANSSLLKNPNLKDKVGVRLIIP